MAATLPRPSRPSAGPPTTALPPLPLSRTRRSNQSGYQTRHENPSLPALSSTLSNEEDDVENPSKLSQLRSSGASMLREPRLNRTASSQSLRQPSSTSTSTSTSSYTSTSSTFPSTISSSPITTTASGATTSRPRMFDSMNRRRTPPTTTTITTTKTLLTLDTDQHKPTMTNASSTSPTSSTLPRPPGINAQGKTVRRTISAAAFHTPSNATPSRIAALPSSPLSAGAGVKSTPPTPGTSTMRQSQSANTSPVTPQGTTPSSRRTKLVGGNASRNYTGSRTPSLLNSSGDSKSITGVSRESDGLLSIPSGASPPESRASSAQGSSSTSATTLEDSGDSGRGQEGVEDGMRVGQQDSKSKEGKGNVIVSVRVRPDGPGEPGRPTGEWMVDGRRSLVAFRGREGGDYFYDNVFATHDQNARVYDASAKRLVRRVMEGYHGTVFAYGQTGTGKTFSMQGTANSPGVIPLAITDIFSYIRETPSREFLLRVSYLEIYNEKIHDLLSSGAGTGLGGAAGAVQEEIKLREDAKRGVYASPLREEIVQSPTQLLRVIARGDQARRTSSTQYNARSSRSHAVVQIVVESRERLPGSKGSMEESKRSALVPGGVRVSTLSLIDLAGSERAAEKKERRTEGAHINKSLLTLGTVIARLSGDKDKAGNPTDKDGKHLPYRDSKLTRLLQPALSGNSLVSILCTIQIGGGSGSAAAASSHTGETLNTLKFAARAKNNIVSHAKKAEEALGSGTGDAGSRVLLERYRMEILELRGELENQSQSRAADEEKEKEKEAELRHEEQMLEMQLARTALKERIEHLNRLILCSKSTGVNSSGKYSSLDARSPQQRRLGSGNGGQASVSARSSTTPTETHGSRAASNGSTSTINPHISHDPNPSCARPGSSDSGGSGGEFGDGTATLAAQISALQADLADKNRYISTLEKRLLQARRSSHSRASMGFSPTKRIDGVHWEEEGMESLSREKDREIDDLRKRLEDKDRMVVALRSAARRRDIADISSDPGSNTAVLASALADHGAPASGSSPLNDSASAATTAPGRSKTSSRGQAGKKGVDEMSRMLDEMIQGRVLRKTSAHGHADGAAALKRRQGRQRLSSFDSGTARHPTSMEPGVVGPHDDRKITAAPPAMVITPVVVPPGMI